MKLDNTRYDVMLHEDEDCEDLFEDSLPASYLKQDPITLYVHVIDLEPQPLAAAEQLEPALIQEEGDGELQYVRVGIQEHQPREEQSSVYYVSIVVACIDAAESKVDFLLTDAFEVSGVQYGHYDIGNEFDIRKGKWVPDDEFAPATKTKNHGDLKELLLSVAKGETEVSEAESEQGRDSKRKDFKNVSSSETCALVPLPIKPSYAAEEGVVPPVASNFDSEESISSTIFFVNKTSTKINIDNLMNVQHLFSREESLEEFEQFLLDGPDDDEEIDEFEGLTNFLDGRLGEYIKEWKLEVFVLPQVPGTRTLWSWTHDCAPWMAASWLSGDPDEGFERQLYIEVHLCAVLKEDDKDRKNRDGGDEEEIEDDAQDRDDEDDEVDG